MRKDFDSSDFFDQDELSLENGWGKDLSMPESEAPFKIGLNFLREDQHSTGLSNPLDNSVSDWRNDSRELSESMQQNVSEFTQDQIYKINNVNEKLRLLVLYENANPESRKNVFGQFTTGSKSKALKRPLKEKQIDFISRVLDKHGKMMQKALDPIKMSRLASIPESKRKFYVKKSDMEDIERKKALKALTVQKTKQFGMKKGLASEGGSLKKKFQDKCQMIEEIMTETATQIEEVRIVQNINENMLKEGKETEKHLKASIERYYTQMQRIHQESMKLIQQELSYREIVLHSRNIKRVEQRKKVRNSSQDLNTILGIASLFIMVPNIGHEIQQVDRSQFNLDASFSKEF